MIRNKKPKLTLVGAGPGSADLITLRGVKALQKADAVLYDALINIELLEYAPENAVKIFVGKRFGEHYLAQNQINQLIIESAFQYGNVVRLKGGDSFVFGRGLEEIEYAEAFGIETEVVPGITSALAVPALQGIPVTHRGQSESFWVVTGTTKNHQISADLALAAQSTATVVILMGMNKLAEIVRIFQEFGKGETPIAIIQNGSTPEEKLGLGIVDNILEIAQNQGLSSPAIIVVGEVASKHKEFVDIKNQFAYAELIEPKIKN